MKASKFTDAQKAFIIRQGEDGTPVEEICRKAGISQATYFNWKKKYAGMMPSEMRRLRSHRQQGADLATESHWRHQPARGDEGRKL
jgi:putative transposase